MTHPRSITKILAPLLVLDILSLKVIALIGESITADARLCGFGEQKTVRNDLDAIIELTSAYEKLQEQAERAIDNFRKNYDQNDLIKQLSDIRDSLITLY
jgi:hypothetical protein